MARSSNRSFLILAALAALIFSQLAHAQAAPITVAPVSTVSRGWSGLKALVNATFEAGPAANPANRLFYTRALTFSETTVANGARTRIALGGAIALSAAMLAAGYLLDELHGQITSQGAGTYTALPFGAASWCQFQAACGYPSLQAAIYAAFPDHTLIGGYYSGAITEADGSISGMIGVNKVGTGVIFWFHLTGGSSSPRNLNGLPQSSQPWNSPAPGYGDPYMPPANSNVSDTAIAEVVKNNPAALNEILTSPTMAPYVWPEMVPAMQQIQAQYRTDTGAAPLPAGTAEPIAVPQPLPTPTPTTTVTPAPEVGTSAPPSPSPAGGISLTFPNFCTWAASVCGAIDWFKEEAPDPQDVPMPEKAIASETWDSGLGAGSCPVPAQVTISGRAQVMTYQPLCDLATGVKPFLLIVAALGAALILAGAAA